MNTQDIVETWRREAIQEGIERERKNTQDIVETLRRVQEGVNQVLERERKLLLRLLQRRFGAAVDDGMKRRVATASAEQIEIWAERELSAATLAEILAD